MYEMLSKFHPQIFGVIKMMWLSCVVQNKSVWVNIKGICNTCINSCTDGDLGIFEDCIQACERHLCIDNVEFDTASTGFENKLYSPPFF